ncbi:S-layer homology domain-containing protein [Pseudomonadota bacterium]
MNKFARKLAITSLLWGILIVQVQGASALTTYSLDESGAQSSSSMGDNVIPSSGVGDNVIPGSTTTYGVGDNVIPGSTTTYGVGDNVIPVSTTGYGVGDNVIPVSTTGYGVGDNVIPVSTTTYGVGNNVIPTGYERPVPTNTYGMGDNVIPNGGNTPVPTNTYGMGDNVIPNDGPGESRCEGKKYPWDIDGHWAEIYVRRLFDLCIVEGYGDRSFRPNRNVSRAELTKMALYAKGIEPKKGCYDNDCGSPFMDLDRWQGPWIRKAFDLGIVRGYSRGRFAPNRSMTRAEAVKVVLSTYGVRPTNTNDSFFNDVEGWSTGWIEAAHNLGIVQGIGNGNFDPNRPVTRAEAAKIIAKTMEWWDTRISGSRGGRTSRTYCPDYYGSVNRYGECVIVN